MGNASKTLVLKNTNLIDGTGADPIPIATVVVEGERIKEISSGTAGQLPSDAQVIDCRQQTLLPGLIDAHVHMGAVDANIMDQQRVYFPSMLVIRTLEVMKETLDQGFTTARDAGGIDPGFRQAVALGLVPSPRLFVAGQPLTQTGGHGDFRLPTEFYTLPKISAGVATAICDGVSAVRKGAREQLRQGVDHIKVMAGGGAMSPSDEIDTSQYSLEELRAAVFEAESAGKYVMAHCYSDRSIIHSIESGIRSIEHGNLLTERSAQAISDAGAYLVPTIVTYEMISRMGRDMGVPENNVRKINEARERALEALDIAHRLKVKIASGSDLLGPMQVYKGTELELKARVLGNMGAIVSTTKTNAELIRRDKDLGTLEEGKLADLILIDGDPLQDITVFQKYQEKITLIIQGGHIYKNSL
ncbi:MAG: amidohydrolase family protein [Desulfobacterales bacterium]|nr:MAG: amidohydrolase family protein [Desulfobacterales bacterium]